MEIDLPEKVPNRKGGMQVGLPQKEYRIKTGTFIAMLIIALILDLISLIPAANDVTLIIAGILFGLWWWKLGLGLINLRKVGTYILSALIEAVPILAILPAVMFAVIVMFVISRTEDKTGLSLPVMGKVRAAPVSKARKMNFKEKVGFLKESNKREGEKQKRKSTEARNKNPLNFVPGKYSKETGQIEDTDKNVYEGESEEDNDQDYEKAA